MYHKTPYHIEEKVFSKEFCKELITQGDNQKKTKAVIADGNNNNRRSSITWLENDKITEILTLKASNINQKNWQFLLTEFEPLQYSVYNIGDYYDWHIDSHTRPYGNGLIRKLSFTLFLNEDYEGGAFRICEPHPNPDKNLEQEFKLKAGSIIFFPSHKWHKVDKVTSGVRKTLVGWIVGTPFV